MRLQHNIGVTGKKPAGHIICHRKGADRDLAGNVSTDFIAEKKALILRRYYGRIGL